MEKQRSRHRPAGKDKHMVTAKGAWRMERQLYNSINSKFFDMDNKEETLDDRAYYTAYAAIQDLRKYLQEKENNEKNT